MGHKLFSMLRSMLLCYLASFLLLCLPAVLLWKMQLSVGELQVGVYAISGLSCLLGGFLSGRILKDRRILWGALFGLCYFAILLLLSILLARTVPAFSAKLIITLLVSVLGGFLGALIS